MEYLADTVAVIRHFAKCGHIGKRAKAILEGGDRGENVICISVMSIAEIMYLAERNRIPLNLSAIRTNLAKLDNYKIINLDFDIVEVASGIGKLELHDRLIAASAKYLGIPILTSDEDIKKAGVIDVIWD